MGGTGTRVGVERSLWRSGSPHSFVGPYDMLLSCVGKVGGPPEKFRPCDMVGGFGGTGGIISFARSSETCASGSSAYELINRCRISGPLRSWRRYFRRRYTNTAKVRRADPTIMTMTAPAVRHPVATYGAEGGRPSMVRDISSRVQAHTAHSPWSQDER